MLGCPAQGGDERQTLQDPCDRAGGTAGDILRLPGQPAGSAEIDGSFTVDQANLLNDAVKLPDEAGVANNSQPIAVAGAAAPINLDAAGIKGSTMPWLAGLRRTATIC
jgi:hypothetical protein